MARRVSAKEGIEKTQETLNAYKPTVGAIRGGSSKSAMVKQFKDLSPEAQRQVLIDAGVLNEDGSPIAAATESAAA